MSTLRLRSDSNCTLGEQALQTTAARVACDINLFEILTEKGDLLSSTTELAEATKTHEIFLGGSISSQRCFVVWGHLLISVDVSRSSPALFGELRDDQ